MNGYAISRAWWDFAFANPEKVKPIHSALLFFAIEHCNRLGWKPKFGLPSQMAMEAIGIGSYTTYIPAFNDLCEWGFFELVQKSKNQYSSNIIALSIFDKAPDKALDKALIKHDSKQSESTCESTCSIDKQRTKNKEQVTSEFLDFWNLYPKKVAKKDAERAYKKITLEEHALIMQHVPIFCKDKEAQFIPHPATYLNKRRWEDEVLTTNEPAAPKRIMHNPNIKLY
jgi:hypothetical protein